MVEQVLHGLGGDARAYGEPLSAETEITCYHVNCRVSDSFEEIGTVRLRKILLILKYCAQAIWCRLRYGVGHLFYVPAPPLRSAIYRDWIVMAICRPFFRTRIFYWQAAGLGEWLACEAKGWERTITKLLLGRPALSIVLADYNRRDAHELESKVIQVIPNFIPDRTDTTGTSSHTPKDSFSRNLDAHRSARGERSPPSLPRAVRRVVLPFERAVRCH